MTQPLDSGMNIALVLSCGYASVVELVVDIGVHIDLPSQVHQPYSRVAAYLIAEALMLKECVIDSRDDDLTSGE